MNRVMPLVVLAMLLAPRMAGHARAWESWCADDPIVSVEGRLIDIQVQMPVKHLLTMRSTTLVAVIPRNTSGRVVVDDVSAFPMRTTVAPLGPRWDGRGPLPVLIVVDVSASLDYPIRVAATPLSPLRAVLASPWTSTGQANDRLVLPIWLEP